MRAHASRVLFGLALVTSFTVLPACVQPPSRRHATAETALRDSEPDRGATAERVEELAQQLRVAELAQQLESMSRYAARMEAIYAEQEAEIFALGEKVASLEGPNRARE